jgi:hypothetical protein
MNSYFRVRNLDYDVDLLHLRMSIEATVEDWQKQVGLFYDYNCITEIFLIVALNPLFLLLYFYCHKYFSTGNQQPLLTKPPGGGNPSTRRKQLTLNCHKSWTNFIT